MRPSKLLQRPTAGFTIVEAMVTVTVFGIFLAVMFVTLGYGFRTYSVALARADVTTEARRLVLFIDTELRNSSYFSVSPIRRELPSGNPKPRRDGVCFVARSNWSDPNSFDVQEARPNWDRYTIYHATNETPSGRLIRSVYQPLNQAGAPTIVDSVPFSDFAGNPSVFMPDGPLMTSPSARANFLYSKVVAAKVMSFTVNLLPATQEVRIVTHLRQNGIMSQRTNKTREGGTFELEYTIKPENTL